MPPDDASARHEAPSPGMPAMPPLRLPMPPPSSAMRPNSQPPVGASAGGGSYDQVGPSPAMQQHMMRLQHEHHHLQHHHVQHYHGAMMQPHQSGNHFHHPHPAAPSPQSNHLSATEAESSGTSHAPDGENQAAMNGGGAEQASGRVQGTPDQRRPTSATSRSPSPSGIPAPPDDSATVTTENGSQRESPASSLPDKFESSGRGGPLRESGVHNTMPPKRMMMPMQHPPPHAQRPHPQHPNGGMHMNYPPYPHPHHYPHHPQPHANGHHFPPPHHHHHPYMNENTDRYRGMEQQQHKHMVGGPPGSQQAKSMQYQRQQQQMMMHHQQQQQQRLNVMQSPPGQQAPPPPPPPRPQEGSQKKEKKQQQQPGTKKKGPDVTMDAASMLLSLRASASPSTVASGAPEEQTSQDQPEEGKTPKTNTTAKDKQQDQTENDGMDDDSVPTLTSSSSSLSAGPPKPPLCPPQEHEVPKNYPSRLAMPNDEAKLNSLHCFLRSELLEIFVVERSSSKSPTHSPGSSVGRVGLRCVFCAMARKRNAVNLTGEAARDHDLTSSSCSLYRDEAPMAVFYPKSIAEVYRLVTSWQRCHLRKCRNLPPDIRAKWTLLRENDKSRGKTHYWITSAKEIGLVDCQSRAGGIRFASSRNGSGNSALVASSSADNDSVAGGLYSVNQSNSEDSGQSGSGDKSSSYQPFNNPNFVEGPSQKHREAAAETVSAPAAPVVESPMKDAKTVSTTTAETETTQACQNEGLTTPVRV